MSPTGYNGEILNLDHLIWIFTGEFFIICHVAFVTTSFPLFIYILTFELKTASCCSCNNAVKVVKEEKKLQKVKKRNAADSGDKSVKCEKAFQWPLLYCHRVVFLFYFILFIFRVQYMLKVQVKHVFIFLWKKWR